MANERDSAERALGELKPLRAIESLNRDIVELLIDKIVVHSEKEIEIVWNGNGEITNKNGGNLNE